MALLPQQGLPPAKGRMGCLGIVFLSLGLVVLAIIVVVVVNVVASTSRPTISVAIASDPPFSTACEDSMIAAENEPNTSETAILSTLDTCETSAKWLLAVEAHPLAGSMTSYVREYAVGFLNTACVRRIDAVVCIDAEAQGLLDFKLDDPGLPALQVPRP